MEQVAGNLREDGRYLEQVAGIWCRWQVFGAGGRLSKSRWQVIEAGGRYLEQVTGYLRSGGR